MNEKVITKIFEDTIKANGAETNEEVLTSIIKNDFLWESAKVEGWNGISRKFIMDFLMSHTKMDVDDIVKISDHINSLMIDFYFVENGVK